MARRPPRKTYVCQLPGSKKIRLNIYVTDRLVDALNAYRSRQLDPPDMSQAIRDLLDRALEADERAESRMTRAA